MKSSMTVRDPLPLGTTDHRNALSPARAAAAAPASFGCSEISEQSRKPERAGGTLTFRHQALAVQEQTRTELISRVFF